MILYQVAVGQRAANPSVVEARKFEIEPVSSGLIKGEALDEDDERGGYRGRDRQHNQDKRREPPAFQMTTSRDNMSVGKCNATVERDNA